MQEALASDDVCVAIATSSTREKSQAVLQAAGVPYERLVYVCGDDVYVADYNYFGIYDCSAAVSVIEHTRPHIPDRITLEPCYPNPFNPTTTIRYDVAVPSRVQLTVYNLLGQEVARLVDSRQLAGFHTITWNATGFPSGIYLCRMEAEGFMQTRKLVLMK